MDSEFCGRVEFNEPCLVGRELDYMAEAVRNRHISGDGAFCRRCQELLEQALNVRHVFVTTSCTHALEIAAMLLDVQPGDEVLVPAFTFTSTANAFVLRGAKPIFVDVRADTLNLDERLLEPAITTRTRAIVPVHYAGVACEMEAIADVAKRYRLAVVEDNAHGLFGKYRDRWLGTLGDLAAHSFHETKNFTCGEGGALFVNRPDLVERAEILREKGTNRAKFRRGEIDKYTWTDVGSSYVLSDMLAGFLLGQLECRELIQEKRRRIWRYYDEGLRELAQHFEIKLPVVPPHCTSACHLYHVQFPNNEQRDAALQYLRREGILTVFHYVPLHLSPMGQRYGGRVGDCPVAEDASGRLLRLPFHHQLTEANQARVVAAISGFLKK